MGLFRVFGTLFAVLGLVTTATTAAESNGAKFQNYGFVMFRAIDMIDVTGPLELLYFLGQWHKTDVALIAETLDPITTEPLSAAMNPMNSTVYHSLVPTHTFETAPELDVLIIPGGPGMRSPYLNKTLEYIAKTAPKVKHVITICTGSGLAARAGIVKGRKVTTNKTSWPGIIIYEKNATWIGHARWVEDDAGSPPLWSSSGVTAGMDLMYRFVDKFYSSENATFISKLTEYERHSDPSWDPFGRNETVYPSV